MAYAQICQQEKVGDLVNFPLIGLDISKHVKMDFKAAGIQPIYDCYAVTNHFGSLNGGHYTAFGQNAVDGNWYNFNDGSVSSASASQVVSEAAYLLFYRRRPDVKPEKVPVPLNEKDVDEPVAQEPEEKKDAEKVSEGSLYDLD